MATLKSTTPRTSSCDLEVEQGVLDVQQPLWTTREFGISPSVPKRGQQVAGACVRPDKKKGWGQLFM